MAKGSPNINWKKHVLEWQASGKSSKAWCKENKIPCTTFYGWKNRFKNSEIATFTEAKPEFIELKDSSLPDSGITLEYSDIKIHLRADFDQVTLKQCLTCLRGALC
jgi:hypothetical protein